MSFLIQCLNNMSTVFYRLFGATDMEPVDNWLPVIYKADLFFGPQASKEILVALNRTADRWSRIAS